MKKVRILFIIFLIMTNNLLTANDFEAGRSDLFTDLEDSV